MAPSVADSSLADDKSIGKATTFGKDAYGSRLSAPLKLSGSLDGYEQFDVTAVIGREFPTLELSEIIHDDDKIRDLAILGK